MDPLFAGSASHDYSLQITSPCIDTGDPNPIYNDPDGTRNDIGAVAYNQNIVYICGDANSDELVNIFDVTYIISFLYMSGPSPYPLWVADVNGDSTVNIFDVTYLISFLYMSGPESDCP